MPEPKTEAERLREIANVAEFGWNTPDELRAIANRMERLERIAEAASDPVVIEFVKDIHEWQNLYPGGITGPLRRFLAAVEPQPEPDPS